LKFQSFSFFRPIPTIIFYFRHLLTISRSTPSNNLLAQDQGNWNQLGKFGVDLLREEYFGAGGSLGPIQHVITQGSQYVQSITYSTSGNSVVATIIYRWTNPTHTVSPYVVINFLGYGEVTATMKTNTPPTLSSGSYTVAQTSTVPFSLVGTDVDGNALTISYSGPTGAQGAFTGTSSSAAGTSATFSGTFDPVDTFANTFSVPATVYDGCANATGQLTFTVTYVNKPPVAQSFAVSTNKNTDVTINFNPRISDPDTATASLKVVILTLPALSQGTLMVGGNAITSPNTQITGQSVVFRPAANFVSSPNFTFTYRAVDTTNLESNSAIVTVTVVNTNAAPVLSADRTSVTLGQSGTAVITVYATDSDIPDDVDVSLVSNTVSGGNFDSIVVSTSGSFSGVIAPNLATNGGTKSFTITITTVASTTAFTGQFVLRGTDSFGTDSNDVTITVTVTATPPPVNKTPYTTSPDGQNTNMNTDIVDIPLTGKDDDAADNANLKLFLTSLPQHGTLLYNGVAITATGQLGITLRQTPDSTYPVTYRPNPNSLSSDSFSFYVQDAAGASSGARDVPITINNTNQPPTSADKTVTTTQDTEVGFTLSTFDPEGQEVTIELINVPAGMSPSSGSVSTPYSFTYNPPAGQFSVPDGSAFATMTFKAKDEMDAESGTYTVTLIVDRLKTPPTSQDETITTKQNTAASVTFQGQGRAPVVAVIDIPSAFKGTLYSDAAMTSAISTGFVTASDRTLHYMPPTDGVSVNGDVFTQFYFKVRDSDSLLSESTYTTTIYVIPNSYGGSKTVNINEDSIGLITLTPTDSFASTDSNALTGVISAVNSGNGALYFCTSESACSSTAVSGTPAIPADAKFAKFVPAAEDSASPYATFSYVLTDGNTQIEATYDVTINVIPVNDPPVIVPDFADRESTPADTPLKLTFSGSDIDDAAETLVSVVTYLPQRGNLFRVVNGAQGTEITEADNVVSATTPGNFEVFFVPTAGSSGRNYATVAFAVEDPHGARSTNAFVTINVTPVNRPPVVTVGGPYRVVQSDTLPIVETSVADPDAGNFNLLVTLQLESGSTGTFTLTDERAFQGPCSWNEDNTVLSCKAAENKLNNFLATLTFTSDITGVHNIIVTVDDLNNGATSDLRGTPGLTDTDKIEITVVPPSTIVPDNNNQDLTIALSVSGAGALAALGIGGFFLGRKLKKAAPADDYFSFMNEDSNDVKINPLFASKYGGPADNPVYTAQV
jgi:hypothetical protein